MECGCLCSVLLKPHYGCLHRRRRSLLLRVRSRIVSSRHRRHVSQAAECLLWVKSGNGVTHASCPFFPSKQTFVSPSGTSAMCQKQTWCARFDQSVTRLGRAIVNEPRAVGVKHWAIRLNKDRLLDGIRQVRHMQSQPATPPQQPRGALLCQLAHPQACTQAAW